MLHCAACGRHLIGQQNRYRHTFPCPTWLAAATPARRAFRHATDHRHKGVSYPADAFEGIVHQALGHVSANAQLVADVVAGLAAEEAGPDPVTLARIEHDRDTARLAPWHATEEHELPFQTGAEPRASARPVKLT